MDVRYATSGVGLYRAVCELSVVRSLRISVVGAILSIRRVGRALLSELCGCRTAIRINFLVRIRSGPVGGDTGRIALAGLGRLFQASILLDHLFIRDFRMVAVFRLWSCINTGLRWHRRGYGRFWASSCGFL